MLSLVKGVGMTAGIIVSSIKSIVNVAAKTVDACVKDADKPSVIMPDKVQEEKEAGEVTTPKARKVDPEKKAGKKQPKELDQKSKG